MEPDQRQDEHREAEAQADEPADEQNCSYRWCSTAPEQRQTDRQAEGHQMAEDGESEIPESECGSEGRRFGYVQARSAHRSTMPAGPLGFEGGVHPVSS